MSFLWIYRPTNIPFSSCMKHFTEFYEGPFDSPTGRSGRGGYETRGPFLPRGRVGQGRGMVEVSDRVPGVGSTHLSRGTLHSPRLPSSPSTVRLGVREPGPPTPRRVVVSTGRRGRPTTTHSVTRGSTTMASVHPPGPAPTSPAGHTASVGASSVSRSPTSTDPVSTGDTSLLS